MKTKQLPDRIMKLIDKEQDQIEKLELARAELKLQEDVLENIQHRLECSINEHFDYDPMSRHYILKDPKGKYKYNGKIATVGEIRREPDSINPLWVYFATEEIGGGTIHLLMEAPRFFSMAEQYIGPSCPECGEHTVEFSHERNLALCTFCGLEGATLEDMEAKVKSRRNSADSDSKKGS